MEQQVIPEWIKEIKDVRLFMTTRDSVVGTDGGLSDGLVRDAFIMLEDRIRATAGLDDHLFGKDLIDKAFMYPKGILQPVSNSPGECDGLYHLLVGIFLFYRNPVAHKNLNHDEASGRNVIRLIDLALELIALASENSVKIDEFVSPHEGQGLRRHDYRIDIDNVDYKELVVILEMGPSSVDSNFGERLVPVIIDKVDEKFMRIPAEGWFGSSSYGPGPIRAINVTGGDVPDLCISWSFGMSSSFTVFLRKKAGKYIIARREEVEGRQDTWMPSGSLGFLSHYMQVFQFADFDGDGATEIVQVMRPHGINVESMGVDVDKIKDEDTLELCRIVKWDPQQELLVQVAENLVLTSANPQGSLSFLRDSK